MYQQSEFHAGKLVFVQSMSNEKLKEYAHAFLFLYSIRETWARFTLRTSDRANIINRPSEPFAVFNEKRSFFRPALVKG